MSRDAEGKLLFELSTAGPQNTLAQRRGRVARRCQQDALADACRGLDQDDIALPTAGLLERRCDRLQFEIAL